MLLHLHPRKRQHLWMTMKNFVRVNILQVLEQQIEILHIIAAKQLSLLPQSNATIIHLLGTLVTHRSKESRKNELSYNGSRNDGWEQIKNCLWTRGLLFFWSQNPNKSKVRKHNSNEVTKRYLWNDQYSFKFFQTQEIYDPETLYFSYDIGSLYWDNKEIEEQKGNKSK